MQQQQSREKRNMYWCYYHSYCSHCSPRTIHNSSLPACNTDSNRITQLMVYSWNNSVEIILVCLAIDKCTGRTRRRRRRRRRNTGNNNRIINTTTPTTTMLLLHEYKTYVGNDSIGWIVDQNIILLIINIHTDKGNNIRIINTTPTKTTMDIKGHGTCLYSSRELKSIDIYLYHIVHEQYRLNTTTNDTTATRNHHVDHSYCSHRTTHNSLHPAYKTEMIQGCTNREQKKRTGVVIIYSCCMILYTCRAHW